MYYYISNNFLKFFLLIIINITIIDFLWLINRWLNINVTYFIFLKINRCGLLTIIKNKWLKSILVVEIGILKVRLFKYTALFNAFNIFFINKIKIIFFLLNLTIFINVSINLFRFFHILFLNLFFFIKILNIKQFNKVLNIYKFLIQPKKILILINNIDMSKFFFVWLDKINLLFYNLRWNLNFDRFIFYYFVCFL
jgi:hypothetical protein